MKAPETRSRTHASNEDEKVGTRKHKTDTKTQDGEQKQKKPKSENDDNGHLNGKSDSDLLAEFEEFSKAIRENLSVDQMKELLEINGQDTSGTNHQISIRCEDVLFFGPLDNCPVCDGNLDVRGTKYSCKGAYSEWSTCTYNTRDPPRKEESIKLTDSVKNSPVADVIKKKQDPKNRPRRKLNLADKPFAGMTISLSGRLSRTHGYWRSEIEKYGGKVANSVLGVTCLVVSPAERERGGSSKLVDAMEAGIPVVREAWLADSIQKQEPLPLPAYDVVSDLSVDGKGIPWDKQDPTEEALESLTAQVKLYGKQAVYMDSKLVEQGGKIFEKDGILYNCAFSLCDQGRGLNEYAIMQLVMVPENKLHLYYKKGRVGDDPGAEERLEEWGNVNDAIKEFVRLYEELTGNEFEPWEREKKFQKKPTKFYPVDMDVGFDVRYGGLGLRQFGIAAIHSKLDPLIANFMKVLFGQEIYKYALMEIGYDSPDLPMGMLTQVHLKRCEETLLEFVEKVKSTKERGPKAEAMWIDFSQRWFTLMHSTRPFIFKDNRELADYAAAGLETVRDINEASRLVGDMTSSTIDDPLSDRYKKLGSEIQPVEKDSDDYKMVVKYLKTTYEPIKLEDTGYGVSVKNVFVVEPSAAPCDEIKKQPNKLLLWCGSRTCNMLRHLHKGFLPNICSLPVPGYMFGRGIVGTDASAEAAKYGFTAVDRPEGFLVLAAFSLGDEVTELTSPPEDTRSLEEKKVGVVGHGRKKTDEKEHFMWKDDIKVPCGRLIPSEHKDSPLEYNEYAVYDPKRVSITFVVEVKFEEQGVEMDTDKVE